MWVSKKATFLYDLFRPVMIQNRKNGSNISYSLKCFASKVLSKFWRKIFCSENKIENSRGRQNALRP